MHPRNFGVTINLRISKFAPTSFLHIQLFIHHGMINHIDISLTPYPRGFHLITDEVVAQLGSLPANGVLNLFIKHTSAGICINENADPSVRVDFETIFNRLVPENIPGLMHTIEGPDDMPAHIKAALVGSSVSIPIQE